MSVAQGAEIVEVVDEVVVLAPPTRVVDEPALVEVVASVVDVAEPTPCVVDEACGGGMEAVEVGEGWLVEVVVLVGTTETGTGTRAVGDERTARYRLPNPTNATSMSAVDHRIGNRRWIGWRSARPPAHCTMAVSSVTGAATTPASRSALAQRRRSSRLTSNWRPGRVRATRRNRT